MDKSGYNRRFEKWMMNPFQIAALGQSGYPPSNKNNQVVVYSSDKQFEKPSIAALLEWKRYWASTVHHKEMDAFSMQKCVLRQGQAERESSTFSMLTDGKA